MIPFDIQLKAAGIHEPVTEHKFYHGRRWRFDFAWPLQKVALEVEGGAFTNGRHVRSSGYIADMEKYSVAAIAGWCVLRVTPKQLTDGTALRYLQQCLPSVTPRTVEASVWSSMPDRIKKPGWDRSA